MSAVLETKKPKMQEVWLVLRGERVRKKIPLSPEIEQELLASGRYEIVYGEIRERAMPSPMHGRIQARIAARLLMFVEENNLGVVYTETLFEFAENLARIPDVAFVSLARFPEGGEEKGSRWHLAPDLAVEVISPTDNYADVEEKISEYFAFGVKQVWIVSPESKTLTVYRSRKQATILGEEDELQDDDVLRGFRMKLSDIFQAPQQAR